MTLPNKVLAGERFVLEKDSAWYPDALRDLEDAPEKIYGIGSHEWALNRISIVGARKATPYGISVVQHICELMQNYEVGIVSGGAYGCDAQAHRSALESGLQTIVVLGGGCNHIYPQAHRRLFQRIIDAGGCVISEHEWDTPALPYMFRLRNRLIAALSQVTIVAEASLPSGTLSTADYASDLGREVMAVPGAITSPTSAGANWLIAQGALPLINDEHILSALCRSLNMVPMNSEPVMVAEHEQNSLMKQILTILRAEPLTTNEVIQSLEILQLHPQASDVMVCMGTLEAKRIIARYPDGRYGAVVGIAGG